MKLIILGAGGHGQSVAEAAELSHKYDEILFLDDAWPKLKVVAGWKVVGAIGDFTQYAVEGSVAFVAVGNNTLRKTWTALVLESPIELINIIHPTAFVSPRAQLSRGIAVMAGAIVGTSARVGDGCIINANSTLDHDAQMDEYSHLGVGVHIAGGVKVGKQVFLQAGSCAGYYVSIPDGLIVAPGTIFNKNV